SFARRKTEMDESDEGLIRFLMRDRHGTPFEHNAFRFHIRCPIFVAREWFRHRISSFNEFSLRYAKATEDFYVPAAEDVRTQVGKPGAYSFDPVEPESPAARLSVVDLRGRQPAEHPPAPPRRERSDRVQGIAAERAERPPALARRSRLRRELVLPRLLQEILVAEPHQLFVDRRVLQHLSSLLSYHRPLFSQRARERR